MTSICDALIDADIINNCQDNAVGFEAEGVAFNKADIDYAKIKYSATNPCVVEELPLKAGKRGFRVKQNHKGAFSETQTSMNAGNFKNTFNNEVHVKVFDAGPEGARQVTNLVNSEIVVILPQKQKNIRNFTVGAGESAYRIYGLDNGLLASECTNDPSSEDIGNAWALTLTETGASSAATFLFKEDYETTEALVKSYISE